MKKKGDNRINAWLKEQPPDVEKELILYAKANYHQRPAILEWLTQKGCQTSLSGVYRWMQDAIQPGLQAVAFNEDNTTYVGIEVVPALERILTLLVKTAQRFNDVIDEQEVIAPEQAISGLAQYSREIRGVATQISTIKQKMDIEGLTLAGAARIREIVMGMTGVRDTPEEDFIRQALDAALLQLSEEISSK